MHRDERGSAEHEERAPLVLDPRKSHGAWIVLIASTAAGALVGWRRGVEISLLVGTCFAGAYLVAASLVVGQRTNVRPLVLGIGLSVFTPPAALALGAHVEFIGVLALALVVGVCAIFAARQCGALSPAALTIGLAALSLAAPAAALAGSNDPWRATSLFAVIWPFATWRTLAVARPLRGVSPWCREELRARGLRESALLAVWCLGAAALVR